MYIFHVTTCMHAHIKQIKFLRFSEVYYLITGNLQCIWWDYWSFENDFLVYIFHWTEKDTGTYNYLADCFYLPILNYWCFELIRFEFFWNFIQIIFKCSWKYERNTCILAIYLQYVRFQAWFHEHLFLVSNTVMKLSWAWVPVHTEIDNIYLQNLWHNGSIDYLRVQTVGPSKLFLFYDPLSIFESMHIVWRKSCLNEKIPDPVRTKCCWLLLLYTVNDHLISARRSKLPFPFIRGI